MLFGLLLQELGILLLVAGSLLLSEHIANEAVGNLLRVSTFFLIPAIVYQLHLFLQCIFHLEILPLLFKKAALLLSQFLLFLTVLSFID
jgi:hypothetical protein